MIYWKWFTTETRISNVKAGELAAAALLIAGFVLVVYFATHG
jgi:hypothetical protein